MERVKAHTLSEMAVADDVVPVAPLPIIEGAVSVVRDRFPAARIEISPAAAVPAVLLLGGQQAFAHVIINLLVNACEGDGSRSAKEVLVRLAQRSPGASKVAFEFLDDGPGFRDELLRTSLRGGLTTKREGTGVGLASVTSLVEASGGTIEIRNRSAGGACVSVSLPAAPRT